MVYFQLCAEVGGGAPHAALLVFLNVGAKRCFSAGLPVVVENLPGVGRFCVLRSYLRRLLLHQQGEKHKITSLESLQRLLLALNLKTNFLLDVLKRGSVERL